MEGKGLGRCWSGPLNWSGGCTFPASAFVVCGSVIISEDCSWSFLKGQVESSCCRYKDEEREGLRKEILRFWQEEASGMRMEDQHCGLITTVDPHIPTTHSPS